MRIDIRIKSLSVFIVTATCVPIATRAYTPPDYPQRAPALNTISVNVPDRVTAGDELPLAFRLTLDHEPAASNRLFVHFLRDGKVLRVTTFEVDRAMKAGEAVELGPYRVDTSGLPDGQYRVIAGVYGEKATATASLTVKGESPAKPPLIINTGTFTDKHGVPHRWHVNKFHTLYWNGEPFLPVGGMLIPDKDINVFKAQIDLLVRNNVRDLYFNVGSSVQMPHVWETKSDEQLRLFQQCVDYMDEKGVRYGMELSGLQAHGYAYDLTGGGDFEVDVDAEGKLKLINTGDNQWIKDGRLDVYYHKTRAALYIITDRTTGRVVAHGKAEMADEYREGKPTAEEHKIVRIDLPALSAGQYKVQICPSRRRDRWNDNMYFWGEDTAKYYQKIRDLYSQIRMGPGFRFIVDAFWNENNMDHNTVPSDASFRAGFAAWLEDRYETVDALNAAWAMDAATNIRSFADAAHLVPVRWVDEQPGGQSWLYLIHLETSDLYRARHDLSQHRYDLLEAVGHQVRDFHIEVADLFKEMHDVPVIFKCFSGMDWWHINNAGISGGFDGLGMESYGVGEPMLTFMGIPAFGEVAQATKTMWLLATEIGEGNHQDQALSRNKLFGCTSRLGTMYPIYTSLMAGGAKGIYHYYMMPSPGADQFWADAIARDPRQLEWLGTFADIVEHAPDIADFTPTACYRFPGLFHPNSGLLYSDPHRDYSNTDTLWWVDPAGKLPDGAWLLPTFTLDVETDMMLINLENTPATLRYAEDVAAYLNSGKRVTWLGYRRDLGTLPGIDRYYTGEMAVGDDGVEFQVLEPSPTSRVLGRNRDGQVWNLIDGSLQIISKDARNRPGWRPQRLVVGDDHHQFEYADFLAGRLGVQMQRGDERLEQFTYVAGDERVTVVTLAPRIDSTVTLGNAVPPYGVDGTGNVVPPPDMDGIDITVDLPEGYRGRVQARYAGGENIRVAEDGSIRAQLEPDALTLIKSDRKYTWAPEGLLFDTENSHATVIIRTDAQVSPLPPARVSPSRPAAAKADGDAGLIVIEASNPAVESNFNLDVFSGLTELGHDALLGLASSCPPPAPDGYVARLKFQVLRDGAYQFWVREGYLAMASPGRWKMDDGPWQQGLNTYVPRDIRLAAQYNALEDERMIFAWYHYANVKLMRGKHTLTYSVTEPRPGGLDIGLANTMSYGKLLDQVVFCRGEFVPAGRAGHLADSEGSLPSPRVNLIVNPSMEQDVGGWSASEWTGDRWRWFELRDDHGWDRDFWWTRKAPTAGRLQIEGLTDIGGLTARHSYVGVRSLRIRAGDHPRRFTATPVPVSPGEAITFGGFVRTEGLAVGAALRVRLLDRQGRKVGIESTRRLTGATHWQSVESPSVTIPAGAGVAVLECHVPADQTGTAWFDDMYLYVQK